MIKFKLLDLFSGIGGFSLGLERSGYFETVAFCEIEPFPRKVLAKHWPEVPQYEDVRTLTAARLAADGIAVDAICGGFPCQDISVAGKQAGISDRTRSGLWSEIARLVGELRPRLVIVENVSNLLSGPSEQRGGWFGRILGDLASLGYDAEWEVISASDVGARHKRERIWIVAYPDSQQKLQSEGVIRKVGGWIGNGGQDVANAISYRLQGVSLAEKCEQSGLSRQGQEASGSFGGRHPDRSGWEIEPAVGRVADGVPDRAHRLAALGNAVVPQIPELLGRAIGEAFLPHACTKEDAA